MSKINVLPEDVINKIAAGEVIERPASVVKELIENSLDAKATKIFIDIRDYGKSLVKARDNGEGMSEEDAKKSVLRHATSKLRSAEDLNNITTLGFRGEALASIAAVSKFILTTKQKRRVEGFRLIIEGGLFIFDGIKASDEGTTVEVADLFFNTPVRKKFLKSDAVELKHIIDVVSRYALINQKVSFLLVHNGQELLNSPAVADWQGKISSVYGVNNAKELVEVNYLDKETFILLTGYISKPYQARNDQTMQNIFVNRRWVRNETIHDAVYEGYHSLLFANKHPIFILNAEINPQKIDVNIHPSKAEIKFQQKDQVYLAVFKAIRETLYKNNLIPNLEVKAEKQFTFKAPKLSIETPKEDLVISREEIIELKEPEKEQEPKPEQKFEPKPVLPPKYPFEKSQQEVLAVQPTAPAVTIPHPGLSVKETFENSEKIPPLKIFGQIHKTFFVAETVDGLVLIDQHVVQERVLYEKFMDQLLHKKVAVQKLLKPELLDLSLSEQILLKENKEQLRAWGFEIEHFGGSSYVLKTVPTIFGRIQPKSLFHELLNDLNQGKKRLVEIQENIITRMACRASVKAGEEMTVPEMQNLLRELEKTKFPYTCPHGRAVLIKISVDELERKFRRR